MQQIVKKENPARTVDTVFETDQIGYETRSGKRYFMVRERGTFVFQRLAENSQLATLLCFRTEYSLESFLEYKLTCGKLFVFESVEELFRWIGEER